MTKIQMAQFIIKTGYNTPFLPTTNDPKVKRMARNPLSNVTVLYKRMKKRAAKRASK